MYSPNPSAKPESVHPHRVINRSGRRAVSVGVLALLFTGVLARAATAPVTNANPAPQSLLARLPDPAQWKKSPLEDVAKGADPIVNDSTFKNLQAAAQRHDAKTALTDLRTLTARYPNKYAALHELRGMLALRYHFIGEAENSFRRVTVVDPRAALGWYSLAWTEVAQTRIPAATADLRASVKASGSFAPGWMLLAACLDRQGKTADATAAATRATQVAPNNVQPWIILAQCKLRQGKPDSAIGDLQHARGIEGKNVLVNESLGACYIQTNQPAKAIDPYQQALKAAPNNPFLCRQLGYCYLAAGQTASAEAACRQGVKANGKYAPAWDMLGMCYRREGKQREAIDAFQHAVNAAPRDLNARAHLDEARLAPPGARA